MIFDVIFKDGRQISKMVAEKMETWILVFPDLHFSEKSMFPKIYMKFSQNDTVHPTNESSKGLKSKQNKLFICL